MSKQFKLNKHITLKLENNKTNIYINNVLFRQCKSLIINILKNKDYNNIESMDNIIAETDKGVEIDYKIDPEVEFFAHCSNLQVWIENEYDTCLLHSELAFPILRELIKLGDQKAKTTFKEEIAKRFEKGYLPVIFYLIIEGYIYHLNVEEQNTLLHDSSLMKNLKSSLEKDIKERKTESIALLILKSLFRDYKIKEAKNIIKETTLESLKNKNKDDFNQLVELEAFNKEIFTNEELKQFLFISQIFLDIIRKNEEIENLFNYLQENLGREEERELIEMLLHKINYSEDNEQITLSIKDHLEYLKYLIKK